MKRSFSPLFLLQLSLGLLFLVTGILGLADYNSDFAEISRGVNRMFGGRNSPWPLIVDIINTAGGLALVLALFLVLPGRSQFIAALVLLVLTAINVVMVFFVDGFLKPDFLPWLGNLAQQLVILSGLWAVSSTRE